MWRLRWCLARVSNFLRPGRADAEMSREMASHLAMLEDEYRRRGYSDCDAGREARKRFGLEPRMHDLHRDARSPLWLEHLRQDLRYTFRGLASNKSYAAIAIITLGLGIGANTAVFSVVHPLMIEPLPFENPGQLVQLLEQGTSPDWTEGGPRNYPLPPARRAELEGDLASIDGIFQAYAFRTTLFEPGEPSSVSIAGVSERAFATLRTTTSIGRPLEPRDHAPGAAPVAVASYVAWQRYWGGTTDAIGGTISVDLPNGRQSFRLVGVLPEEFDLSIGAPGAPTADFWLPGDFSGHGTGSGLTTILRIRDGLSVAAAAAEAGSLLQAMGIQSMSFDLATGDLRTLPAAEAALVPLKVRELEQSRIAFMLLAAIVGLVLLIACMNVASLMLGRMAARKLDLAIRASLGASRSRLVRQVFTESLVLGAAGGVAGVLAAWSGLRLLTAWPGNIAAGRNAPFVPLPRVESIELDGTVLAFTLAVSLLTGILCGISPAVSVGKGDRLEQARRASAAAASNRGDARGRSILIVTQIALAMVLLISAGLLMSSFMRLASVDPGFDTDGVITFQVTASREHFRNTEPFGGGVDYFEFLADEIRRIPGVEAAGHGPPPFLFGSGNAIDVDVPGSGSGSAVVSVLDIGEGYLEALGVPVLRGRGLSGGDGAGRPFVILVNETFVRQHMGGQNPVGMRVGTSSGHPSLEAEIVGVVGDIRRGGLSAEPYPQVFRDYRQAAASGGVDYWWAFFAVRTAEPQALVDNLSAIVRRFDGEARIDNIAPLEDVVAGSIASPRFLGWVFTVFAVIGITIAVIGLYGAISYFVTQRTSEIGIRMALGATSHAILSAILRRSAWLTLVGIGLGTVGAVAGTRYMRSMLFEIEPIDAPTFIVVALGLFAVATVASSVPARRASRVSPMVALREE